jgi:hypothetical protein
VTTTRILAAGHTATGDHVLAGIAGLIAAVILVGLVLLLMRWPRMGGARSRREALDRAFGEDAGRRIGLGMVGPAVVLMVAAVIVKISGA